jgi:hypothetical protein
MSLQTRIATELRCGASVLVSHNFLDLPTIFLHGKVAHPLLLQSMVKSTDERRLIPQKTVNQLLKGDHARIFEIDRSNLVLQLRSIRRAINETAEEMEMVAIERVFAKPVSQTLTRTARKLYRLAEGLYGLNRMIEHAHPPAAPARPKRKPRPRNRPKPPS